VAESQRSWSSPPASRRQEVTLAVHKGDSVRWRHYGSHRLVMVEGYAVTSRELPAGYRTSGLLPVGQRRRGHFVTYEQSRTGGSTRKVPACMPTSLASKVVQSLLPQLLKGHLCCYQQDPRSVGSSWEPASQTELL
jgi:hypothetical protein